MTFREIEKLLLSKGWYYSHTNGSHYIYKNNKKEGRIVVPRHKEKKKKGTLNSILKQAGIK